MIILGINAYHADASAAIIVDGKLIAAAEEERFRRIKHWAGFPTEAIRYCLSEAGITVYGVDHFAISRDPHAHFFKKAWFAMRHRPKLSYLKDRLRNLSQVKDIKTVISEELGVRREASNLQLPVSNLKPQAKIHYVEHHRAHMASSFFVSPFDEAAVISVDALGDFVSTMWGRGEGRRLKVGGKIMFPDSLGFLYTAATQYLGFPKYGDEYKVMGLAAFGEPEYLDAFRKIIRLKKDGNFELHPDYFRHYGGGVSMSWEGGEPVIGPLYTDRWEKLFGPPRKPGKELTKEHKKIAASLQLVFEDAYFCLINQLYDHTRLKRLCIAGGCAMNSVANGKIFDHTPFEEVYIQSAAGDAGTAIGSAYFVWNQILGMPRSFVMDHSYWGPAFDSASCRKALKAKGLRMGDEGVRSEAGGVRSEGTDAKTGEALGVRSQEIEIEGCRVIEIPDEGELCKRTAVAIADGKIVGWFQGRMEWGARALGNRSILADPRRAKMKDVLNTRIKRREPFRPFAPSILIEAVGDYFEKSYPDPFMIKVYPIKKEKRSVIPAVTHVDGTGRLQTVDRHANPLYWRLIKEFEILTGVPVLLNTSFNENEPIVCTPEEALECFLRTKMDLLVLGNYWIERAQTN